MTTTRSVRATTNNRTLKYVVYGSRGDLVSFDRESVALCTSQESILKVLPRTAPNCLWISKSANRTSRLAKTLVTSLNQRSSNPYFGDLLMLRSEGEPSHSTLDGLFRHVVGLAPQFAFLPLEEMLEVLQAVPEMRKEVFVGGVVDKSLEVLMLVRGDLEKFVVPLSMFGPSGRSTPDFSRLHITDYGHTISFGKYEATSDVILWQLDKSYRAKAKARLRNTDGSFGGSLRRLRKQRGLSQDDFPNVARKTISRIENGQVDKPQGVTLKRIARALGVEPEDIESY